MLYPIRHCHKTTISPIFSYKSLFIYPKADFFPPQVTLFPPTNKLFILPCVPPYPLLREFCVLSLCLGSVAQSCLTLCDPIAYRPPGSSVHGIFQARILEWAATPFSRGSSQPRGWTHFSFISCIGRQILYHCTPGKSIKLVYKPPVLISLSHISLSLLCRHT